MKYVDATRSYKKHKKKYFFICKNMKKTGCKKCILANTKTAF